MIDAALQPLQQRFLQSPAQLLDQWGVKADQITLFGFLLGVMVVPALAFQAYPLALLFLLLNRLPYALEVLLAWYYIFLFPRLIKDMDGYVC